MNEPKPSWRFRASLVLHLTLFALWVVVLIQVLASQRLWEGDFPMYYTGFRIIADGRSQDLYDPDVQRDYQQAILTESQQASGDTRKRAYADGWLPYNYPPHTALLGFWVAAFELDTAMWIWTAVQLLLLGLLAFWVWKLTAAWERPERLFALSALLAYLPWLRSVQYGQLTLVVVIVLVAVYRLLAARRDATGGGIWLLGTIKPQLVLMPGLGVPLLKRWRALAVMVGVGLAWALTATLILGFDSWLGFLQMLDRVVGFTDQYGFRPDEMMNLRGLIWPLFGDAHAGLVNTLATVFLGLAVLASAVVWWRLGSSEQPRFGLAFSATMLLGVFFSPHLYVQDTLLCVLPAILLYDHLRTAAPARARWLSRLVTIGLLAFVFDIFQEKSWGLPRLPQLWVLGLTAWTLVELVRAASGGQATPTSETPRRP